MGRKDLLGGLHKPPKGLGAETSSRKPLLLSATRLSGVFAAIDQRGGFFPPRGGKKGMYLSRYIPKVTDLHQ